MTLIIKALLDTYTKSTQQRKKQINWTSEKFFKFENMKTMKRQLLQNKKMSSNPLSYQGLIIPEFLKRTTQFKRSKGAKQTFLQR